MVPNLRFSNQYKLRKVRLGDICTITGGYAFDSHKMKQQGEYQIIKMGNLYNGIFDLSRNQSFINAPTKKELEYLIQKNDILITLTGTTNKKDYGYTVQIEKPKKLLLNQRCALIRASKVNEKYLFYLLNSNDFLKQFYASSTGGTGNQTNVSINDMLDFKVYISNENDQLKISNILNALDKKISTQIKIIDTLLSEINSIRSLIFNKSSLKWIPLKDIVAEQNIKLKRGKVIPKHKKNLKYIYPVYSSSITNSGLMGYSDSYMFNQELITWSIDGGGNFFYRKKHKFNITNVSGYMILNENLFNYQFIVQSLIWQHEKLKFDYQTKAHPSVVESLYKIPIMDLEEQHKYACLFSNLNEKYELELHILDLLNMQKKCLLKNMFV